MNENQDFFIILILSGDHIYSTSFDEMIEEHVENNADVTIGVYEVPLKEASRFGILVTDNKNRIVEFQEKPAHPISNLASMGIYLFKYSVLREVLITDAKNEKSSHDFGKDVIPMLLNRGDRLFAYKYKGYWKDVGTIKSLWEANMDLLGKEPKFDIFDKGWKFYSRNDPFPPQLIMDGAVVKDSLITVGCYIEGTVINSLLGANVRVRKGAVVKNSVIFDNVEIKEGATVEYSLVAERAFISANAKVLGDSDNITVIAEDVKINENKTVEKGSMVEEDI